MSEPAPKPVPPLPSEVQLLHSLRRAVVGKRDRVEVMAVGQAAIRAHFLRWFLLEAIPATNLPITTAVIVGFSIEGQFNLNGCNLTIRPRLEDCGFNDNLYMEEANIPGLELLGIRAPAIYADRAKIGGSLLIRARGQEPGEADYLPLRIEKAIRLNGATAGGNIDMEGAQLGGETTDDGTKLAIEADGIAVAGNVLMRNHFGSTGEIRINGARIQRNLDCSGATLQNPHGYTLSAAGAHIHGSAYFGVRSGDARGPQDHPFESQGALRLDGACIDGDLDCGGGKFTATAFLPNANEPDGDVIEIYAIRANGLKVGADIEFSSGFHSHGTIDLTNATTGKDLICTAARFESPGGEALCADGATIGGTAFIGGGITPAERLRTNGVLRFTLAKFMQGLYVRGASFEADLRPPTWLDNTVLVVEDFNGAASGILAREAVVSGTFILRDVTCTQRPRAYDTHLKLPGSRADVIDDDLRSWTQFANFDVTDCSYRVILGLVNASDRNNSPLDQYVDARVLLLDREYAVHNRASRFRRTHRLARVLFTQGRAHQVDRQEATDRFRPQPYLQLARALRSAGLDQYANNVMVHLEKNRTRYGEYDLFRRLGRYCLDGFLRYGYSTFRPIIILAVWSLISAYVFQGAYSAGRIVPTSANQKTSVSSPGTPEVRVQFNAIVFALDTLVPLVDLNQRKSWVVDPSSRYYREQSARKSAWYGVLNIIWRTAPDRSAALLFAFNTFFGWLLTTLFAGGVTGFLRRGQSA